MFKNRGLLILLVFMFLVFGPDMCFAETTVELEPIVVTPWRGKESISDVSRGITVITKQDIDNSGANYLPELLQHYTGISVADYFGNPKGTVVDIRGFGESSNSNVLVLIDGRRTNQVDLSGVDWAQIDLNAVDRIEIVRGPSTVLYGDNAAAGVINIITKKGRKKQPEVVVGTEWGSYQYKKGFLEFGGASELMDYFFTYAYQDTSGYRSNNDYLANDCFGKITVYPADVLEVDISAGYHRDHYGMPGPLYPHQLEAKGRRGTVYDDDRGFTSDYFATFVPKFIVNMGNADAMLSFFNSYRDRRAKGLTVYTQGVSEYETAHHIKTYEFRPQFEIDLFLAGFENKIKMGTDYFFAEDSVLSGNRIGDNQDETDIKKQTLGMYIHDSFKLFDRVLCNAGFRGEWADYKFSQTRLVSNEDSKSLRDAAFNAGVGYKYNDKAQVYFDFSRSYRLPNTEEYYQNKAIYFGTEYGGLNADIKHQKTNSYELGIRDVGLDLVDLNADIFLMEIRNEIYYDPSTWQNSNYKPETRHYGLELETVFNLLDGKVRPFAYWTLQKSYFKGGTYANNLVPFVPANKITAGVTVSPVKNLNWTVFFTYVGSRYKISDQKNIAPVLDDYTVFDTTIDYKYKDLKVWLAVKNLFNKEYNAYGVTNSTGTAETFYPAPERNLEVGASIEF
ncbi:MAG: TonB-dependent receptor [Candidatus Omnitrophota bacterium]